MSENYTVERFRKYLFVVALFSAGCTATRPAVVTYEESSPTSVPYRPLDAPQLRSTETGFDAANQAVGGVGEERRQKAESAEAAFLLSWNMTLNELRKKRIVLEKTSNVYDGLGEQYHARLPKRFDERCLESLLFTKDGKLFAIIVIGPVAIAPDPYGIQARTRYDEIKSIIAERIPIKNSYEFQDSLWKNADEFWMSLKTGRGAWSTFFENSTTEVMLELKATGISEGTYVIRVEHKSRMADVLAAQKAQKRGAF